MQTKVCSKCGAELPSTDEYFHRDHYAGCGLTSQCKSCRHKAWGDTWEKQKARREKRAAADPFAIRQRELAAAKRSADLVIAEEFPNLTIEPLSHDFRFGENYPATGLPINRSVRA